MLHKYIHITSVSDKETISVQLICFIKIQQFGKSCDILSLIQNINWIMDIHSQEFIVVNSTCEMFMIQFLIDWFMSTFKKHFILTISLNIIGGHRFLDGVGVDQKICRPPLATEIFSRRPFHQGVILLNRNEKKCSSQGSICPIFFSPWGYQGGGVNLFHLGCRPQKVFYPLPIYAKHSAFLLFSIFAW